jgi:ketosteroid isomerase-like protein
MPANSPEEICHLFQRYMSEGDVESLLSLYDPEAVFLTQSREVKKGEGLREELTSSAAAKHQFDFNIRQVIHAGDIALMHTDWKVSAPKQMSVYAIEVARRQRDGTWRWLIGDPFTVGMRTASGMKIA